MSDRARKGSALSFKAWSNFEWGDPAALMNRHSVSNCSAKAINSTLSTGTNVARRRNRSANHETSSETDASMPEAPPAHRRHAPPQTLCDGEIALALRRPQHQLGTRHYRVRQRTRGGQRGHLRMLFSAQHQLRLGSPNRHRHLSLTGNDAAYASKNY